MESVPQRDSAGRASASRHRLRVGICCADLLLLRRLTSDDRDRDELCPGCSSRWAAARSDGMSLRLSLRREEPGAAPRHPPFGTADPDHHVHQAVAPARRTGCHMRALQHRPRHVPCNANASSRAVPVRARHPPACASRPAPRGARAPAPGRSTPQTPSRPRAP